MQLSDRLLALAQMVSAGNTLADVGCDHGYIPIYLIENEVIHRAVAMDIGKGPLKRAEENIRMHGLEEVIDTRLSDGLTAITPGECDRIIIAGMGGPLMEKILTTGAAVIEEDTQLVLQPQSHIPHFRRFLMEQGYEILDENMIYEDGKYYPMMKVTKGKASYDELECRYGPHLLKGKSKILYEYLNREIQALETLIAKLENNNGTQARIRELEEELEMALLARRRYDS